MDAMGHVNNTLYFRYMELHPLDWMLRHGLPADPQGEGPVIVNAFCNFIRQLEFPGDVLVRTYVGSMGRTSFDTYHEMLRTDDPDTVYANGGATVVWVDFPGRNRCPCPSVPEPSSKAPATSFIGALTGMTVRRWAAMPVTGRILALGTRPIR
jgi:acyl-CoA thioester hydrolase